MVSPRALGLSFIALVVLAAPAVAQSGSFGNSVVIDGDALLIGEPNNTFRPGTVYLYKKVGGEWVESARITAPAAERADGFGAVLARTDNTLFVASRSGRIDAFERSGATWAHSSTLVGEDIAGLDPRCNYNGYCEVDYGIALEAADDWLLVGQAHTATDQSRFRPRRRETTDGAPSAPPGAVHAFQRGPDGRWVERQQISSPDAADEDAFGATVSIVGDRALIGAPGAAGDPDLARAGRVYEYRLVDGVWRPHGELTVTPEAEASFGATIAARDGRAIVGAPFSTQGVGTNKANEGARYVITLRDNRT